MYGISKTQSGLLGGAFMLGFVAASPVFAHLAERFRPMRMMAFGLFVWCLATTCTGISVDYVSIFFARMATGVGEASFLCLAPPFIDRAAPPAKRSLWLSIFYVAIPLGYAFGSIVAGEWIEAKVFSVQWQWRHVFLAEAVVMLFFVWFCATVSDDAFHFREMLSHNGATGASLPEDASTPSVGTALTTAKLLGDSPSQSESAASGANADGAARGHHHGEEGLEKKLKVLLSSNLYICICLAYAAQTFVVGGFAYWGVEYSQKALHFSEGTAGAVFGSITAVMGIVGTAFGGWLLDHLRAHSPHNMAHSLTLAVYSVFVISVIAMPAAVLAFAMQPVGRGMTLTLLAVSEFAIFACLSPINSAIMWSVPFRYNPIAIAMSVVSTHVLGDATSPIIVGAILDRTHNNWNVSMMLCSLWLGWSVLLFFLAWRIAVRREERARLAELGEDDTDSSSVYEH